MSSPSPSPTAASLRSTSAAGLTGASSRSQSRAQNGTSPHTPEASLLQPQPHPMANHAPLSSLAAASPLALVAASPTSLQKLLLDAISIDGAVTTSRAQQTQGPPAAVAQQTDSGGLEPAPTTIVTPARNKSPVATAASVTVSKQLPQPQAPSSSSPSSIPIGLPPPADPGASTKLAIVDDPKALVSANSQPAPVAEPFSSTLSSLQSAASKEAAAAAAKSAAKLALIQSSLALLESGQSLPNSKTVLSARDTAEVVAQVALYRSAVLQSCNLPSWVHTRLPKALAPPFRPNRDMFSHEPLLKPPVVARRRIKKSWEMTSSDEEEETRALAQGHRHAVTHAKKRGVEGASSDSLSLSSSSDPLASSSTAAPSLSKPSLSSSSGRMKQLPFASKKKWGSSLSSGLDSAKLKFPANSAEEKMKSDLGAGSGSGTGATALPTPSHFVFHGLDDVRFRDVTSPDQPPNVFPYKGDANTPGTVTQSAFWRAQTRRREKLLQKECIDLYQLEGGEVKHQDASIVIKQLEEMVGCGNRQAESIRAGLSNGPPVHAASSKALAILQAREGHVKGGQTHVAGQGNLPASMIPALNLAKATRESIMNATSSSARLAAAPTNPDASAQGEESKSSTSIIPASMASPFTASTLHGSGSKAHTARTAKGKGGKDSKETSLAPASYFPTPSGPPRKPNANAFAHASDNPEQVLQNIVDNNGVYLMPESSAAGGGAGSGGGEGGLAHGGGHGPSHGPATMDPQIMKIKGIQPGTSERQIRWCFEGVQVDVRRVRMQAGNEGIALVEYWPLGVPPRRVKRTVYERLYRIQGGEGSAEEKALAELTRKGGGEAPRFFGLDSSDSYTDRRARLLAKVAIDMNVAEKFYTMMTSTPLLNSVSHRVDQKRMEADLARAKLKQQALQANDALAGVNISKELAVLFQAEADEASRSAGISAANLTIHENEEDHASPYIQPPSPRRQVSLSRRTSGATATPSTVSTIMPSATAAAAAAAPLTMEARRHRKSHLMSPSSMVLGVDPDSNSSQSNHASLPETFIVATTNSPTAALTRNLSLPQSTQSPALSAISISSTPPSQRRGSLMTGSTILSPAAAAAAAATSASSPTASDRRGSLVGHVRRGSMPSSPQASNAALSVPSPSSANRSQSISVPSHVRRGSVPSLIIITPHDQDDNSSPSAHSRTQSLVTAGAGAGAGSSPKSPAAPSLLAGAGSPKGHERQLSGSSPKGHERQLSQTQLIAAAAAVDRRGSMGGASGGLSRRGSMPGSPPVSNTTLPLPVSIGYDSLDVAGMVSPRRASLYSRQKRDQDAAERKVRNEMQASANLEREAMRKAVEEEAARKKKAEDDAKEEVIRARNEKALGELRVARAVADELAAAARMAAIEVSKPVPQSPPQATKTINAAATSPAAAASSPRPKSPATKTRFRIPQSSVAEFDLAPSQPQQPARQVHPSHAHAHSDRAHAHGHGHSSNTVSRTPSNTSSRVVSRSHSPTHHMVPSSPGAHAVDSGSSSPMSPGSAGGKGSSSPAMALSSLPSASSAAAAAAAAAASPTSPQPHFTPRSGPSMHPNTKRAADFKASLDAIHGGSAQGAPAHKSIAPGVGGLLAAAQESVEQFKTTPIYGNKKIV